MKQITLIGDSIFDNKTYVDPGEPDVTQQVKGLLDHGDTVTRLAVDGDITADVERQLQGIPDGATHLFISVGGNDALGHLHLFESPVPTIGAAFSEFYEVMKAFEKEYVKMLNRVLEYGLNTTLCTIYHPCFEHESSERIMDLTAIGIELSTLQKKAMTALPIFNDIIFQEAVNFGLPVMDLRLIFNEAADYANPIEPSAAGGMKMAKVITEITYQHDFSLKDTVVYR